MEKAQNILKINLHKKTFLFCSHIHKNVVKLPIYCSYLKGMSSGRAEGQWSDQFYSKGWVIFLLSSNLQLLNEQNNFGLNQLIQWSRVRLKQEQMRAFGVHIANSLLQLSVTLVCMDMFVHLSKRWLKEVEIALLFINISNDKTERSHTTEVNTTHPFFPPYIIFSHCAPFTLTGSA